MVWLMSKALSSSFLPISLISSPFCFIKYSSRVKSPLRSYLIVQADHIDGSSCYKAFQLFHIFAGGNETLGYIGQSLFPAGCKLRI